MLPLCKGNINLRIVHFYTIAYKLIFSHCLFFGYLIGTYYKVCEMFQGIAFQSKKCAMCRAVIPSNYLDNPILLGTLSEDQGNTNSTQEVYQWFYEGRNGILIILVTYII